MFPTVPSSGGLVLAPTTPTPTAGIFATARDLHSQLHIVDAAARAHEATRLALAQRRHALQESLRVLEAAVVRERAATAALQRELHAERARTGPTAAWSFDFRYDVPAKAVALLGMGDGAPGQGGLKPIFQGCMRQLEQRLALVPKGYARMDDTPDNEAGAAKKLKKNAKALATAKRYVAEKIRQKRRASWEASGKQPRKRRVSKSQIVHKGLLVTRT